MKYTEEEEQAMIVSDLLRYADHHRHFKRDYVDDVYDFMEKYGYITEQQFQSLQNIYMENNVYDFLQNYC